MATTKPKDTTGMMQLGNGQWVSTTPAPVQSPAPTPTKPTQPTPPVTTNPLSYWNPSPTPAAPAAPSVPTPTAPTAPAAPKPAYTAGSNVNVNGTVAPQNNITAEQIKAIMDQNSAAWKTASAADRITLQNQNQALGQLLGGSFNAGTGTWNGTASGASPITAEQIIKVMQDNGTAWHGTQDQASRTGLHDQNQYLTNLFGIESAFNSKTGVWDMGKVQQLLGGGGNSPYDPNNPSFGKAIENSMGVIQGNGQSQRMSDYESAVRDYGQAATNPTDPYWDNIRKLAESLGLSQYTESKTALQNLLSNLSAQQRADLEAITGNLDAAKNEVSNKTFQDWLAARQNLANRGLQGVGSGFQQDADTRLMMNQQNALGKLFADANQNIAKTNANYGEKLANAEQKMSGLNLTSLQSQQFNDMFKESSGNLLEMAKVYAGLTGKQMPYSQFSTKDLLDSNYNYDKLNEESRQFYDKLNAEGVQFYDKLKQDYKLDMTKIMGKDAQGNNTLDMNKFLADVQLREAELSEKIRSNRATESISMNIAQMNNTARANELAAQITNNNNRIQLAYDQLGAENANSEKGRQLQALISQSNSLGSTYSDLAKINAAYAEKGMPVPAEITKMAKEIGGKLNSVYTGFEIISGMPTNTNKPTNPAASSNSSGTPDLSSYLKALNSVLGK